VRIALSFALAVSGCYLSHEPAPRERDAGNARDASIALDASSPRDARAPSDAGVVSACPVLRHWPLDAVHQLHVAGDPTSSFIWLTSDDSFGVRTARVPWALDEAPRLEAGEALRVYAYPIERGDRVWWVGTLDELGRSDYWYMWSLDGTNSRESADGVWPSMDFDGTAAYWWARYRERAIYRSTEDRDQRMELDGSPELLAVIDTEVLPVTINARDGSVFALGRSHHGRSSWIARIEVGVSATVTHAIRQPGLPNPYRSSTDVQTATRLVTANSRGGGGEVVIREFDRSLAMLREQTIVLPENTGRCKLHAIDEELRLFCGMGAAHRMWVYEPFAGADGVELPFAPLDDEVHAQNFAWVARDRAVVTWSVAGAADGGGVSLVCIP
jgi:hypothetical protein